MDIKTLKGNGTFSNNSIKFESNFEIIFFPYRTIICPDYPECFLFNFTEDRWNLIGLLDDGRSVESNNLLQAGVGNNNLFVFELRINCQETQHSEAKFPLIGFYGGKISLVYNGFEIELNEGKDFKEERSNYKKWRTANEGSILSIKKQGGEKKEFLDNAITICKLLSIATANDVIFNNQIFDEEVIIHKRMRGNFYGFVNIIPDNYIEKFLKQSISNWSKVKSEDRELISDISNYINSSSDEYDYLDDRMFRIAQCWEMMAKKWTDEPERLPDDLDNLKSRLKNTCKEWRKEYPKSDPHGFWAGRVLDSLKWISFVQNIENLISEFKISIQKLDIDTKKLKDNIRDKVAHEGRMISFDNHIDFFEKVMFGVRLILLNKVGYDGKVEYNENGWKAEFEISKFFE